MSERPAPPQLPRGWKAQWDEEYKRYFYVNEKPVNHNGIFQLMKLKVAMIPTDQK